MMGGAESIRAVSGPDGRYRMEGLPVGQNLLALVPPESSPLLFIIPHGHHGRGSGPARRGPAADRRRARQRPRDRCAYRMPVAGRFTYFPFQTNPHRPPGNILMPGDSRRNRADTDGRFAIPVLPGPGILTFSAAPFWNYPLGAGAERIDGPRYAGSSLASFATNPICFVAQHSLLTGLDPAAGTEELTLDLTVTSGVSVACRVLSPAGQPLRGVHALGLQSGLTWRQYESKFEIEGYFPAKGRRLMFSSPADKPRGPLRPHGRPAGDARRHAATRPDAHRADRGCRRAADRECPARSATGDLRNGNARRAEGRRCGGAADSVRGKTLDHGRSRTVRDQSDRARPQVLGASPVPVACPRTNRKVLWPCVHGCRRRAGRDERLGRPACEGAVVGVQGEPAQEDHREVGNDAKKVWPQETEEGMGTGDRRDRRDDDRGATLRPLRSPVRTFVRGTVLDVRLATRSRRFAACGPKQEVETEGWRSWDRGMEELGPRDAFLVTLRLCDLATLRPRPGLVLKIQQRLLTSGGARC